MEDFNESDHLNVVLTPADETRFPEIRWIRSTKKVYAVKITKNDYSGGAYSYELNVDVTGDGTYEITDRYMVYSEAALIANEILNMGTITRDWRVVQ